MMEMERTQSLLGQWKRRTSLNRTALRAIAVVATLIGNVLVSDGFVDEVTGPGFVKSYCVECHGSNRQEADFRIDNVAKQSPQHSRKTWQNVWRQVKAHEMPPEDVNQPTAGERDALLAWIVDQYGQVQEPADVDHWSLKPPVRPSVPAEGTCHPIDAFVDQLLQQSNLARSVRADRSTILRRVTLDLTGLLPTREETQNFLNDEADFNAAYARVVERLLESPRYGERWAQHWLDVIRWAETVGFETNAERRDAWHYRDWVIRAFNEDLPYDRFLTDQLLGDETGADAALGFLVAGPANLPGQIGRDEEAMRQARQDELDEVIQTVSQGLFGLTVGCARCHDHKFDPISQRDYYSMQAIFAGLKFGTRRLRGERNDAWTAKVPLVQEQLSRLRYQLESTRLEFNLRPPLSDIHSESFEPILADAVRMEIYATNQGAASLYEFEIWSTKTEHFDSQNVATATSGSIATASSFALANQTRHFDNLIDGSVDQRQAFPWVAASEGPAWLQVDLAAEGQSRPTEINQVTWHSGNSVPASYEIKVREAETGKWITVAHTRDRLPRLDDTRPAKAVSLEAMDPSEVGKLLKLNASIRDQESELRRFSSGPQVYAASFSHSPEKMMLLHRGDPMQPREEAIASVPAALIATSPTANPRQETDRRKMLVDHLTHSDHPLTARVMANRIWQHHFGIGLVETASDFGRMGQPPSHPELLDWLAVEFVESGWSVKHLHRTIVLSQAYLQSSRPRAAASRIDSQSRLLWRYPPRRLDAEAIRDSILQASGKLNETMYGRGFDFFNHRGGLADFRPLETFAADGWRRMIYAHKIRMQSVDVFGAFDCPDAGQMTPRRNQSITPIQALGLLNSPFVNRQSEFFAARIGDEVGENLAACVERAFEIALTRSPTPAERTALLELASEHGLPQACLVILNTSEFVSLQ
jgi:hypothetical protein